MATTTTTAATSSKKVRRALSRAVVNIKATFNNTVVSFCDPHNGEVLLWDSAGSAGYKGSRKSTPFAAQKAAERAAQKALKLGIKDVEVRVRGPGSGRESAVRALAQSGLKVKAIEDRTPVPHNGCRPRKRRRV
ncbi:MAG: 30S ribosomal protein S11 [Planctomycetes bacterium]|nr:30S ribosomal protein S11 [Planctomycetota bacterium]